MTDPGTSGSRRVDVVERDDGALILTNPVAPAPLRRSMVHTLLETADVVPDRTLIAEKLDGEWHHLTYADAVDGARRVAQWLLDQRASVDRPLAILSKSSRRHFLMAWGAQMARVPYVPVSVSYSTVPGAYPKLESVLATVKPAFVFAEDLETHRDALDSIAFDAERVTVISADGAGGAVSFDDSVASTAAGPDVDASIDRIDHDTVTRYMFTSGSTGMPKGVIHTQGMACQLIAATEGRVGVRAVGPEVRVLDWMPWSHVGAGVMRVNGIITNGGSIFLDTGRPVAGEHQRTIDNLREVRPTMYAGSPLGYSMLVDALEADDDLAAGFFADVTAMQGGSAAMPKSLAERLDALTAKHKGVKIAFGTSLLSTEVSCCLSRFWPSPHPEVVGLPSPGAEVKLVPAEDGRYELRVRSLGNTPGYLGDPEKTADSFDEEGFFKMGDAVRFFDEADPNEGLVFAGRVAEQFKLQSGTWVSAGSLRAEAVTAASPYVRDVVVCGLNQPDVALLVWPNIARCRELAGDDDVVASAAVREAIASGFAEHNRANPGSSKRIARFLLLESPPEIGAFEITDKGYVNQAAALSHRADDVARLYTDPPDDRVFEV